jgi:hypothetical protein
LDALQNRISADKRTGETANFSISRIYWLFSFFEAEFVSSQKIHLKEDEETTESPRRKIAGFLFSRKEISFYK